MGIVLFTIKKYRFISITPEFIGKDITENIEEGIILLDPDLKIIFKNSALLTMLKLKDSIEYQLEDIFFEKDILNIELSNLIKSDKNSFSIRINLIESDTKKNVLADVKVKKIIDDYKDISGFLMIISRVKNLEQLKERYKISARELDVIHHIIVGNSNKEIAEILNVTESTVKTHIASIYDKLNIKNRVELLNLLFEFTLSNPPKNN
jgi:DNA-binding CsgD family transcriptional regulator